MRMSMLTPRMPTRSISSAQHEDYDWELAHDQILECQEREDFAGDDWDHGQYDQYDEY